MHLELVPFNDLRRNAAALSVELSHAFERVLASGWFVMGPEHDAFERELAAFVGVAHAIAVGNGTDALQLAMTGLGVTARDLVLTAANAGGYASAASEAIGATPVYADVDPDTHMVTPRTLDSAITELPSDPAALVVTHLYGAMADLTEIVDWARSKGIPVIEDCAQALGASRRHRRAGSLGDVATTSFYPTKNLGGLGDGGAVLTSNDDVAARVRRQRQYGWSSKYHVAERVGQNSRLDEMQAAFLRVKLSHLDDWNERRREIHRGFERALTGSARWVNSGTRADFIGHLAVLVTEERDVVREIFARNAIQTDVHYPIPDHRQPTRQSVSGQRLPVTERLADAVLSVPLFPELRDDEILRIHRVLAQLN